MNRVYIIVSNNTFENPSIIINLNKYFKEVINKNFFLSKKLIYVLYLIYIF